MIGKELERAIGDAPDHIAGLRKLAVAFAIGGRFNGPSTASPEELLSQIETTREQLEKAGKLKRKKAKLTVLPEHLPEAFNDVTRFVPLAEIASIEKGKTGIKQAVAGEFPLVATAASRESCDHYDFDAAAAIIPLVSSTGHGNASINRLHYQEGKFALGTILAAILPHDPEAISARFLFEYLSAFKEELLVSRMTGTANVTLTIGRISEVPVPLLSRQAQAKVDELMALCDRLEEARKTREKTRDKLTAASFARLTTPDTTPEDFPTHANFALEALPALTTRPDQIKTLRQTILNLAVRGKLNGQDGEASFDSVKLNTLAKIVRGSSPRPKGDPRYYGGSVPRLLIADITRDGKYVIPTLDSLTEEGAKLSRPMPKGSLVIAISGSYGIPAFLAVDTCIHDGFIGLKDVASNVDLEFLYLVLLFSRPYFDEVVKDSGLKNLTTAHLKDLLVPLPSLSEQNRIVAKVDALMALCDRLETALSTTDTTRTRLLEALLHEALEPTSEVLEAAE